MAEGIYKDTVSPEQQLHKGHRERLRQRFVREGLAAFEDHNVLELLLFYAIPRRDTNPIAHELIRRFGSLEQVLEAPLEELVKVDGVGETAANLIKLCYETGLRTAKNRPGEMNGRSFHYKITGEYLLRRFEKNSAEEVYGLFYDKSMVYTGETLLHRGRISSASFSLRQLAEAVSFYKASYVVIAHNHPQGRPIASSDDLNTSRAVKEFLAHMRVTLLEHYVLGNGHYCGTEHRQ